MSEKDQNSERKTLRLSISENEKLEEMAKQNNLSVNEYIKRRLFTDQDEKDFSNCSTYEKKSLELMWKILSTCNAIALNNNAEKDIKKFWERSKKKMEKLGVPHD